MTEAEKRTVQDFLHKKGVFARPCPVCHLKEWRIAEDKTAILCILGNSITDDVYPTILVMCDNCGYCQFHGANKAGVK